MELKDLTALGIAEDTAGKVLTLHNTELSAETEKTGAVTKELDTARAKITELTGELKKYDGTDPEKLKADLAAWEKKYAEDMAAAKIDSALDLALTKAGARDIDLAKHCIDRSIIKSDGEKLIGLDEQLSKLKTDKAFLFSEDKPPAKDISTGFSEGDAPSGSSAPTTLRGALSERYARN